MQRKKDGNVAVDLYLIGHKMTVDEIAAVYLSILEQNNDISKEMRRDALRRVVFYALRYGLYDKALRAAKTPTATVPNSSTSSVPLRPSPGSQQRGRHARNAHGPSTRLNRQGATNANGWNRGL